MDIPHILLEGGIDDLPFIPSGAAANFINQIRWKGLLIGTQVYDYGRHYYTHY
jgi:hypothetical protein